MSPCDEEICAKKPGQLLSSFHCDFHFMGACWIPLQSSGSGSKTSSCGSSCFRISFCWENGDVLDNSLEDFIKKSWKRWTLPPSLVVLLLP